MHSAYILWMLSVLLLGVPARARKPPFKNSPLMKQLARTDDAAVLIPDEVAGVPGDEPIDGRAKWGMDQPMLGMETVQDMGIFVVTNFGTWGCRLNSTMMAEMVEFHGNKPPTVEAENYKKYVTDGCLKKLNTQLHKWAVYDDISLKIGPGLILSGMSGRQTILWGVAVYKIGKDMLAALWDFDEYVTVVYRLGLLAATPFRAIAISQGPIYDADAHGYQYSVVNIYATGIYDTKTRTSGMTPAGIFTMSKPVAINKYPTLGPIEPDDDVAFLDMTYEFSGEFSQDYRIIASTAEGEGEDAEMEDYEDEDEGEECP